VLALSRGVGQLAVNGWTSGDEINERNWSENDGEQYQKRHFLHRPKRRDVGSVTLMIVRAFPADTHARAISRLRGLLMSC
jgi:hypothetical protein